jgi:hypothetical protein
MKYAKLDLDNCPEYVLQNATHLSTLVNYFHWLRRRYVRHKSYTGHPRHPNLNSKSTVLDHFTFCLP